jgi:hypothetical protein
MRAEAAHGQANFCKFSAGIVIVFTNRGTLLCLSPSSQVIFTIIVSFEKRQHTHSPHLLCTA